MQKGGWFVAVAVGMVVMAEKAKAEWEGRFGFPGGVNSEINGKVTAFASSPSGLYIGGTFSTVGGSTISGSAVTVNHIAFWNGKTWEPLGSGVAEGTGFTGTAVTAIAVDGPNVYVGGNFKTAGGLQVNGIAKWDGEKWTALGNGVTGGGVFGTTVYTIKVDGQNVYVGGNFATASGVAARGIARWDGTQWSSLANNSILSGAVHAIEFHKGELYIGGTANILNGPVLIANLARLNGDSWSAVGSGVSAQVNAMVSDGSDLYVGGFFTTAGGLTVGGVARWSGGEWGTVGAGVNAAGAEGVNGLAMDGTNLYATGYFTNAGGAEANAIARWNGTAWSTLGEGISSPIGQTFFRGTGHALAVHEGELYVGGSFTRAGDLTITSVARWDGEAWGSLGVGLSGLAMAVATDGENAYVGGMFQYAGGIPVNSIARWDGSRWHRMGGGVTQNGLHGQVHSVVVRGNDIFVAGVFNSAGGVAANNVAHWDGTQWKALGSGITSPGAVVRAIAVDENGNVYAGGFFSAAGGAPARGIAMWNGTTWTDVGGGIMTGNGPGEVRGLAIVGGDLYVGGAFNKAGELETLGIVRWNGSAWSSVASGMNSTVLGLTSDGTNVYAVGNFTMAGNVPATRIARWDGAAWSALGEGLGTVEAEYASAVTVRGSEVYAGGSFTNASGMTVNYVAKWDGESWSALAEGVGNGQPTVVNALAATPTTVYAGGTFMTAGNKPALGFAAWTTGGSSVTAPVITLSLAAQGKIELNWSGDSGASYQVMSTTDLGEEFNPFGPPIVPSGPTGSATVDIDGNARYFRVERLEP